MAVAYKSQGGWSIGQSGTFAVVPTGGGAPAANDVLLVVTESCNTASVAGTPVIDPTAGYTQLCIVTRGDGGAGVTTLAVWAKRAVGGDSGVWVTGTPNHVSAEMFVYSGADQTTTPWTVGSTNSAASGNGTMTGLTTAKDNSIVIMICTSTRDANSTAQFSSWANANLTSITERDDNTSSLGAGGGFGVADGFLASQGATGNSTVTIATSEQWCSVHVALAPQTAQTYEDSVTIAKKNAVTDTNNLVMSMAASIAKINAVSEGNIISMFPSVTLTKIDSASTAVQQVINDFITIAKKDGMVAAVNAVMGAALAIDKKASITVIGNLVGIVTKGYVTVLDFSANPVSVTSFRSSSVEAEDL